MRIRTLIAVGVFVLAVTLVAVPSTAASVPVSDPFVTLFGVGLLAVGLILATKDQPDTRPKPPRPEEQAFFPFPGADVDAALEPLGRDPGSPAANRVQGTVGSTLRARLRHLAEQRIQDQYNVSETQAKRAIETGAWTTDPHAQAFFARYPDGTPLRTRLKLAVRIQSSDLSVQATQAIESIANLDTPGSDTAPSRATLLARLDAGETQTDSEDKNE